MNRANLLLFVLLLTPRFAWSQAPVNKAEIVGSWLLASQRNLKSGVVDSVTKHRTAWCYFSPTRIYYLSEENNRAKVNAADFAKMSPAEKQKANYARIWNEKNEGQFGALGLTYRVEGHALVYTQVIAMNPAAIGTEYRETITQPDKNTMLLRTVPDTGSAAREETWKRVIE